jgi:hypothetical protein
MMLTKHFTMAKNSLKSFMHVIYKNSQVSQPMINPAQGVAQWGQAEGGQMLDEAINKIGITGSAAYAGMKISDSLRSNSVSFNVRKLSNGYLMDTPYGSYVARTVEELQDLFTTELVKNALENK